MLATPVDRPFTREGWLFELKWDGVRAMASVAGDAIRITGRRGRDETARYPGGSAIRAGSMPGRRSSTARSWCSTPTAVHRSSDSSHASTWSATPTSGALREHPVTYVAFDLL